MTPERLTAFVWTDTTLHGYVWRNGGRDLSLSIELGSGRCGELVATWVGGFTMDIRYHSRRSGPTLSWQVESTIEGVRRRVVWDFASDGSLEFTCNDLEFREAPGVFASSTSALAVATNPKPSAPPVEPPTFQVKTIAGWGNDVMLWADPCGDVMVKVVDARWGDPVEMGSDVARELARLLIEAADECDA